MLVGMVVTVQFPTATWRKRLCSWRTLAQLPTNGMCSETGGARAMPTAALKENPCELHFDCTELSRTGNLSKLRRRLSLQRVFGWQGLGMQEASGEP